MEIPRNKYAENSIQIVNGWEIQSILVVTFRMPDIGERRWNHMQYIYI